MTDAIPTFLEHAIRIDQARIAARAAVALVTRLGEDCTHEFVSENGGHCYCLACAKHVYDLEGMLGYLPQIAADDPRILTHDMTGTQSDDLALIRRALEVHP